MLGTRLSPLLSQLADLISNVYLQKGQDYLEGNKGRSSSFALARTDSSDLDSLEAISRTGTLFLESSQSRETSA